MCTPESPSSTVARPTSTRGSASVRTAGVPGRQPHTSMSQARPVAEREVSSRDLTDPRSSPARVAAVSGTRTSCAQYEAVRSLPGSPSRLIRPSLAFLPEASVRDTSS
ncbi:hypothetical protein GCM10017687_01500 [Streptomyces echinatus]